LISGMPDAPVTPKSYQVSATNSGGSATDALNLGVIAQCPVISYEQESYEFTRLYDEVQIDVINSNPVCGAITSCELLVPEQDLLPGHLKTGLPKGLQFNTATCAITGVCEEVSWPPVEYMVVGGNTCGTPATTKIKLGCKAIQCDTVHWPALPHVMTVDKTVINTCPIVNVTQALPMTQYSVFRDEYIMTKAKATFSSDSSSFSSFSSSFGSTSFGFTEDITTTTTVTTTVVDTNSLTTVYGLPAGLTMDPTTGCISGTPTQVTKSNMVTPTYHLQASNTGGTCGYPFNLTILAQAPNCISYVGTGEVMLAKTACHSCSEFVYTLGKTYKETALIDENALLGNAKVTYSVVGKALPTGCTFNDKNGDFTCTPTVLAPTFTNYTVKACNSGGCTTTCIKIKIIAVCPTAPVFSTIQPWTYNRCFPKRQIPTVRPLLSTNHFAASTKCTASPPLPVGLSLNDVTCEITGSIPSDSAATCALQPYKIKTCNSCGCAESVVSFEVKPESPSEFFMSGGRNISFIVNHTVHPQTDEALVDECTHPNPQNSVTPPLPAGLYLDHHGQVIGKPLFIQPCKEYTFVVGNCGGSRSYKQLICITPEPFCPSGGIKYTGPQYLTLGIKQGTFTPLALTDAERATAEAGGAFLVYQMNRPLPAGMQLDIKTGAISGTPTQLSPGSNCACENYTITVTNGAYSCSNSFCLRVVAQKPALDWMVPEMDLLPGTRGLLADGLIPNSGYPPVPYYTGRVNTSGITAMAMNMNGVNASLTSCSVNKPLLPGLKLALNNVTNMCEITGTPTKLSCDVAMYKVTGSNCGGYYSSTVSVGVKSIAIPPTRCHMSGGLETVLTVDGNYDGKTWFQTPKCNGDLVTNYSSSPLPAGIVMDKQTGIVSGKCQRVGTYNIRYSMSNCGGVDTYSQTIHCIPEVPKCLTYSKDCDNTTKVLRALHNVCLNATLGGGTAGGANVVYSITPALPNGLTFSTTNGTICGAPLDTQCASTPWVVTASNSAGSVSTTLGLTVLPDAPNVHYKMTNVTRDVLGQSYVYDLTQIWHNKSFTPIPIVNIAGVQPNAQFAQVTSCRTVGKPLPKGLTLSANCTIGGIAKEMSWPPEKYIVEGSNCGGSGMTTLMLGVRAIAPTATQYTDGKCTRWVAGIPIAASFNLVDSDSDPIVSTSVVPALPAGVTLNSTDGTVHGVPTMPSREKNYTFTVSNSGGSTSYSVKIEVLGSPPLPWKYQISGLQRAKEVCTLKSTTQLKQSLYKCTAAKSASQHQVEQLTTSKNVAEAALHKSTTQSTKLKADSVRQLEMLAAKQLMIGNLTADVATLTKHLSFVANEADNRTLLVQTNPKDTAADHAVEATIAVWDTVRNTLATNYTGVLIVSLGENENREAGQYFPVVNGLVQIKYKSIQKTGTYKLHAATGDRWPLTISTVTKSFKVTPGAASKINFVKQPLPVMDTSLSNYSVSANVTDMWNNLHTASDVTAALTIPGNNFSKITTFKNGIASFTNLEVPAGKGWRMLLTATASSTTFREMSTEFKVFVTPAIFTHALSGMDSSTWSDSRTQTSYKTAMASTMGDSVGTDDITITSVKFSSRRTSSATISSSVALTNAAEARNAVAALEQATGTSSFVSAMKSAAKTLGVTLPANLASSAVTGTSSKNMKIPSKYANAASTGTKTTVVVQSSSSSSDGWRITAIVFMAAFGLALVGMTAFSVYSWKQKSRPKEHVMGSSIGMTAHGGMEPGAKIETDTMDESTEDDANAINGMALEMNDVRGRSGSSTTHRVDLDAVYGDVPPETPQEDHDTVGQI
jgi:hypothetical protein